MGFTSVHCLNHVASTNWKPYLTKVPRLTRFWLVLVGFLSFFIGCISLVFLHCEFSNVSSNRLPERMQSHIHCICFTFPHCVFANVFLQNLNKRKQNHIGWICLNFPYCALANVFANCLPERMHNHIGCICFVCLHCAFPNVFSNCLPAKRKFTLVAFAWLFSTVCFPMFP